MRNIIAVVLMIVMMLCSCSTQKSDSIGQETELTVDGVENKQSLIKKELKDKVIVIDPGHGLNNISDYEPIAPGSSKTKPAYVSGTSGKNQTEEQFNLALSQMLEKKLTALGASVHMTRTTHESTRSNIERAQFANELNADIAVKIHADGNENSSVRGVSMLIPSDDSYVTDDVYNKSAIAGKIILDKVIDATGTKNRGISERSDMTGFNWSTVPVILLECGFMSNPQDDALLETDEYKQKIVDAIADGLILYFENQKSNDEGDDFVG